MKVVRLPCVICDEEYAPEEIATQLFISTGVCRRCYLVGCTLPANVWCFASEEVYDKDSEPCKTTCPDRRICHKVLQGQLALRNPDYDA